ncbi:MAG: RDD family protein [Moraxellaceae bacterium]|jgi:uncharacterized RDD family membrane protein YckC|nr:RDD family protein [Moraxellaceae bacterium]MBP8851424.1 RDD family protein [Moraxellaceae bacterium]MBP9044983.1 RDD family protein [Moraxellaceae bacterium]MBP9730582.1 RDD family protein [Moraxellaceae bacterium]MCC6200651.1 RDD family protein [Moraxellaceae bacterium]
MPKKSRKLPAATTPPEISSAPAPELAGMLVRLYCLIYDGLLLVALWMITAALLVPLATPEQAAQQHQLAVTPESFRQLVLFPALVIITWLFYGYFWTRVGQTLGMQTWRLKVVRADGHVLRWSDAIARCASACIPPIICGLIGQLIYGTSKAVLLSLVIGFIANYLWMLWSGRHLAWHDQLSRTVVLRLPPEPKDKKRHLLGWFSEKNG